MDLSPAAHAALFFTAICTSAVSSTLGMAGGFAMLSALTVFVSLREAIPLHGFTQLLSNGGRIITFWQHIEWKLAGRFALLVLPGAYIGVQAMKRMQPHAVEIFVGTAILWVIHAPRAEERRAYPPNFFILLGFLSASIGMIAGATGPLIIPFFMGQGLDKKKMVGTKAFCQGIVQFVKIPFFTAFAGFDVTAHGKLLGLFFVATVIGTFIGSRIIEKMSERVYEFLVKWTVTALTIRMVVGGINATLRAL
jgi:uncharacterized membrane protein YfcA